MDTIKATIYQILSAVEGIDASQGSTNVFNTLPAVTFNLAGNSNELDLNGNVLSQQVQVKIDIWGETSPQASDTLSKVDTAMRAAGYTLVFTQDVPNPADDIYHITTRYQAAVV